MANTKLDDEQSDCGLIEIVIPIKLAQYLASGVLNVDNFCRMCMNENAEMSPLFSDNSLPNIAEMFTLFSSIQVHPNDGLPPHICPSCRELVVNCYEFKQQCEKADIIWKTSLKGEIITNFQETSDIEIKKETVDMFKEINKIDRIEDQHNLLNTFEVVKIESNRDESSYVEDGCDHIDYQSHAKTDAEHSLMSNTYHEEYIKKEKLAESILFCGVCRQSFTEPKSLVRHLKVHETATTHSCSFCNKEFTKVKNLRRHIEMKHKKASTIGLSCDSCSEKFGCPGDLHIHSSLHIGSGKQCNTCYKEFPSKQQLIRHLRRHMEEKRYKCDMCGKKFSELYAVVRHRRIHTGEVVEKKHACDSCDKRFVEANALRIHRRVHTGERPCVCAQCGRSFLSARLLRSHMLTHDDHKPHQCLYCDKRFRHESTRNTHHRTHTGEKPFVCAICGKTFIQNSNLRLHMRTHSGEKPYSCRTCQRQFTAISTLKAHERTHTGEKPFGCNICGKRFARLNLNAHMRRHTGEKPFSCTICPKQFATATRLRDHSRVHTGEKPYECAKCEQTFASSSHLHRHKKTHEEQKIQKKNNNLNKKQMNGLNNLPKDTIEIMAYEKAVEVDVSRFTVDNVITQEVTLELVPDMEVTGELELRDGDDPKADVVILEQVAYSTSNINFLPLT